MKFFLIMLLLFLAIVFFFKVIFEFPWLLLIAIPVVLFMSYRYEKQPPE